MNCIEEIRTWKATPFERCGSKWTRFEKDGVWAEIADSASVDYRASVEKTDKFLYIGPLGSREAMLTVVRKPNGETVFHTGCFHGTEPKFLAKLKATHGDNEHSRAYRAAIKFCKAVFGVDEKAKGGQQ